MADRYGRDVLSTDWRQPPRGRSRQATAELGLVVEEAVSGFCGEITRVERDLGTVELEDRHLRRKVFPLGPGFLIDGSPVILVAATPSPSNRPSRTASGSVAAPTTRARVALPSRVYVEGRHDAELVEKVWGDDLRAEGVAVEYLGGIDDLNSIVRDFNPDQHRRLGVLVDHLVPGSKEFRIAQQFADQPHVLVVGHPYVDVWQAVKPERLGIAEWPTIRKGTDWKHGICDSFGWPHRDQKDIAQAWKRILGTVRSYTDLEPSFLGRVEELIDFVTAE